ncbi:MAG: hypothetical protein ACM3ZT_01400 [Bacillota bacterium]
MKNRVRVFLLAGLAAACLPAWSFTDAPDPVPLLNKLPAPPKSFAEAQARCANPKEKGEYIPDPQSQALADEVSKDLKSFEDTLNQQAKANVAQAQAAAFDPQQGMALAQAMQAQTSNTMPPNADQLTAQILAPVSKAAEDSIQSNTKQEADNGQSWQKKYDACGHLPGFLATGCQKPLISKANSDSDGYIKQRHGIMDKYYSDLNAAWPQYVGGLHKFLDAQQFQMPQGVDPKGYQMQLLKATNQDQRLKTVQVAAHDAAEAICPHFMYEVDQRYGGICEGEGC